MFQKSREEMVGTIGNIHIIVGRASDNVTPQLVLLGRRDAELKGMDSPNKVTKVTYYVPFKTSLTFKCLIEHLLADLSYSRPLDTYL